MKRYVSGILASALICLVAFGIAVAARRTQDEPAKPKNTEAKKAEPSQNPIAIHIIVSAEGVNPLPQQSSVQLKGLDDCDTLARRGELDADGQVTFSDLPACKVMLRIFITGFETKAVPEVDLANPKNSTLRIQVKSVGPPILN